MNNIKKHKSGRFYQALLSFFKKNLPYLYIIVYYGKRRRDKNAMYIS